MIFPRESIRAVLDRLGVPERSRAEAREALEDLEEAPAWFIRLLSGLAAWWAALSFLGCLGLADILDASAGVLLGLGLLSCAGAVVLRITTLEVGGTFLPQLALATSIAGQSLTMMGLAGVTDSETATLAGGVVLEVALLLTYPDPLHRFLCTVSAGAMASGLLVQLDERTPLHLLSAPLLLGAIALWQQEADIESSPAAPLRVPVGFGLLAWMFASLIFALWAPDTQQALAWLTSLGLTGAVGALASLVLRESGRARPGSLAAAWGGVGLLGLLTANTPGILAALGVMLLAFHRRAPLLLSMGAMFLAGFLTFFYYDLELSLWTKSGVLIGSGGLMLLARLALAAGGRR